MAQRIKHLPAMQETRVQSLGWEDPLEKEMAIHSSILAWRIPWREEAGRLQSMGLQRVEHDRATSHMSIIIYVLKHARNSTPESQTKLGTNYIDYRHKSRINGWIINCYILSQ